MHKILLAFIITGTLMFDASAAMARSTSGSHSHSSKSKSSGNFIVRKCKTQACSKKHPDGKYSVPLHKKKQ